MKYGPVYHFPIHDEAMPIKIPFIGVNHCQASYHNIRIDSPITVLACVLSGQGQVTCDSITVHPGKEDVFILPKGRYHEVSANPNQSEEWVYIWFNINEDFAVSLLEAYQLNEPGLEGNSMIKGLFQKAIRLAESQTAEVMHHELPLIFHEIVMSLSNLKFRKGNPHSPEVWKIKNYLDGQIQGSFSADQLSRHIGLSFKQINRLFKKEMNTTVYNYLLMKKIEAAKMMLLDTDLNVSEISDQLGYSDPHYFSNLFKKKVGVPPSSYKDGRSG